MRQSLAAGNNYSLIEEGALEPRPDYFTSVLWKRLLGELTLKPTLSSVGGSDEYPINMLRAYAHCVAGRPGALAVAVVNLDPQQGARIEFPSGLGSRRELYLLTADDLLSPQIGLNGRELQVASDWNAT